jgi:hypothetical protein
MHGVMQTAQTFVAEDIAGDTDNEHLVAPLAEDHLGGHTGIGASQYGSEGRLDWSAYGGNTPAERTRVERDDLLHAIGAGDVGHFSKVAVALHEHVARFHPRSGDLQTLFFGWVEAVDDVEHAVLLRFTINGGSGRDN